MSEWAAKRFWTDVTVVEENGAFSIKLDARPVRTPAKSALVVPTQVMARHIADEWQAQTEVIDPQSMPWTRSANAACVSPARARCSRSRLSSAFIRHARAGRPRPCRATGRWRAAGS